MNFPSCLNILNFNWVCQGLTLQGTPHNQPTNSIEQSPFSEANSHSASQVIPHLLRNLKVHHPIHNSPPIPRPCVTFRNKLFFMVKNCWPLAQPPKLEDRY